MCVMLCVMVYVHGVCAYCASIYMCVYPIVYVCAWCGYTGCVHGMHAWSVCAWCVCVRVPCVCAVCVARVQWVGPTEHGSSGSCVGMEGTRKFILKTLEVSY